jgi:hypothetical protein
MSNLTPEDPAYERYEALAAALGGEPVVAYHREVLARLASWTDAADIETLVYLIGETANAARQRFAATVQHIPLDPTRIRTQACWSWCGGASEPHSPDLCYRDHSIVPLSLEPALRGETGVEPTTVDLDIEVNDRTPVVGLAVGEDTAQHRILTVVEARQLAASLLDAADLAAAVSQSDAAGGAG